MATHLTMDILECEVRLAIGSIAIVQQCWKSQLCLTFFDPMDCSTQGLSVPHFSWSLPKSIPIASVMPSSQSHPLIPFSPSVLNLSQHQGYFQWISCSYQMTNSGISASASVLPMSTPGLFPLKLTSLSSLMPKGFSGAFSSTTVWRH